METPASNRWEIDTSHSDVQFTVRHMVVTKARGRFTRWAGSVDFDENDLTRSSVTVRIDADSIDTGHADRDAHLRSPDFLDAESHPRLEFRSTGIDRVDVERYRIHGDLTIRGVTRRVTLDAELGGIKADPWGAQRAGFSARTKIDRRDFGLTWNQALEAGGLLVGEKVDIELEVEAVRPLRQAGASAA
jgi:polyisoprenoid-binding protein YceI